MSGPPFLQAFAIVVGHEGGFDNNRDDPGNWTGGSVGQGQLRGTKYGISAGAYPTLPIADLTLDDARAIYRRDYWDRVAGDELAPPLALLVFDAAVNNGVGRAVRWLQVAVGANPDGVIGPATRAAITAGAARGGAALCSEFQAQRLSFMASLPTWANVRAGLGTPAVRTAIPVSHHDQLKGISMLALIPLAIQLVPEIAKWLFGDDAEKTTSAVVQAVSQVTGTDVSTEAGMAAASAVLAGKPELAAQLQVQIAQIAAGREKDQRAADAAQWASQLADVANARQQTVALAQAKSAVQWAPVVISGVVLITFGAVMWLALTRALPAGSETILNMLLGTLAAMATSVVSYWVGSSAGSAHKTDLLYRSTPP